MSNSIKIREEWADVLKGIGITAVVVGHTYDNFIYNVIFSFHMPLFFFLGGYFHKKVDPFTFLKKQSQRLLIPYFSFLIPLYLYFFVFENFQSISHQSIKELILRPLLGGQFLIGPLGVFWFISCYFCTLQLYNYLQKFSRTINFVVFFSLYIFSYLNAFFFESIWSPFNVHVVAAAYPFVFLGDLTRKIKFNIKNTLVVILALLAALSIYLFPENRYDMKYTYYGKPVFTTLTALVLIFFLTCVSKWLVKTVKSNFIAELGKASLVIMYLHLPFKFLLRPYVDNDLVITLLILLCSFLVYTLMKQYSFSRIIFLGHIKK